jgi:hypothetical protein
LTPNPGRTSTGELGCRTIQLKFLLLLLKRTARTCFRAATPHTQLCVATAQDGTGSGTLAFSSLCSQNSISHRPMLFSLKTMTLFPFILTKSR